MFWSLTAKHMLQVVEVFIFCRIMLYFTTLFVFLLSEARAQEESVVLDDIYLHVSFSEAFEFENTNLICEHLKNIFTRVTDAPWGMVFASDLKCKKSDVFAKDIPIYKIWTLQLDKTENSFSAELCRKTTDITSTKCEAKFNLAKVALVPELLTDKAFLRGVSAYLLDALPMLGKSATSIPRLGEEKDIPNFIGKITKAKVFLDSRFKYFQVNEDDSLQNGWIINANGRGKQKAGIFKIISKSLAEVKAKHDAVLLAELPRFFPTKFKYNLGIRLGGGYFPVAMNVYLPSNMLLEITGNYKYNNKISLNVGYRYKKATLWLVTSIANQTLGVYQEKAVSGDFVTHGISLSVPFEYKDTPWIIGIYPTFIGSVYSYMWNKSSSAFLGDVKNYSKNSLIPSLGAKLQIERYFYNSFLRFGAEYSHTLSNEFTAYTLPVCLEFGTPRFFQELISYKTLTTAGIKVDYSSISWSGASDIDMAFVQLSAFLGLEIWL